MTSSNFFSPTHKIFSYYGVEDILYKLAFQFLDEFPSRFLGVRLARFVGGASLGIRIRPVIRRVNVIVRLVLVAKIAGWKNFPPFISLSLSLSLSVLLDIAAIELVKMTRFTVPASAHASRTRFVPSTAGRISSLRSLGFSKGCDARW